VARKECISDALICCWRRQAEQLRGKAIALRLAHDGYDVCVNDLASNKTSIDAVVKQIQELGRKATGVVADVSKLSEVEEMVRHSVEALGPLKLMVANAGIAQVKGFLDLTEADFDTMYNVNIKGVFNCYTCAAKTMIKQGTGGKIVGASSVAGVQGNPLMVHYSAAKFAVRGLTQGAAQELGKHNITVNAYAPGIISTPMWDAMAEDISSQTGAPKDSILQSASQNLTALKRVGMPEDVANLVSFFGSQDSNFVTGQTYVVDGGMFFT